MGAASSELETPRLALRPWRVEDAPAGLKIFGDDEVSRWLSPVMEPVPDESAMRAVIEGWSLADSDDDPSVGRWTVTRREDGALMGSIAVRHLLPDNDDLELAWQFAPDYWGNGYATEAADAVARWAFARSAHELFAVLRPGNERAAGLARRLGMQWVGETDKYYDLRLQVYRLRPPDLPALADPSAGTG